MDTASITSTPKPSRAPKRDLPGQAEREATDSGNSGGLQLDSKTAAACQSMIGCDEHHGRSTRQEHSGPAEANGGVQARLFITRV